MSRQIGSDFLEAVGISKLGAVEQAYSELASARFYYEEANGLFARLGMIDEQGRCLLDLAKVHFDSREFAIAEVKAQEAMGFFQRTANELGTANCLNFLGEISLEAGNPPQAKDRIEAAQKVYEKLASSLGRANCLKNLGRIALKLRDASAAVASFVEALDLYKLISNRQGEADCQLGLGDLQQGSDPESARTRYREALEIYTRIGDPFLLARAHVRLGHIATGENERREHMAAARAAWKRMGRSDFAGEIRREMASVLPDTAA